MAALLVVAGVILLVVAGFGVSGPRFHPQWFGFALVVLGAFWAPIVAQLH